jgi:hypothetical protein
MNAVDREVGVGPVKSWARPCIRSFDISGIPLDVRALPVALEFSHFETIMLKLLGQKEFVREDGAQSGT